MVHKKSAYKLEFKDYSAESRRDIFFQNSLFRMNRKAYEMSHQSIQEDSLRCDCDDFDESSTLPEPKSTDEDLRNIPESRHLDSESYVTIDRGTQKYFPHHSQGVFKVSSTGEYDLLPAAVSNKTNCRSFRLHPKKILSSPDLRYVGVVPSSMPIDSMKRATNWKPSKVSFNIPDSQIGRAQIRSTRNIPRVRSAYKSHHALSCKSCGEALHNGRIMA